MHSKRNHLVVVLCVLAVLVAAGCGGGGGGKTGPVDPVPPSKTSETFAVSAGQAVEKTVGNVGISIPAGTFTRDATVTVELLPILIQPTNGTVGTVGGDVALTSSIAPSGPITIKENGGLSRSTSVAFISVSWIEGKWKKIGDAFENMGQIQAAIDPVWFVAGKSLRVLLNAVNTSYDNSVYLTCLAGDSSNQTDNVAILVHGIMSDENAMKPLAQALVSKGYRSAWGLHYAWQRRTIDVAPILGDKLLACLDADLYCHSRGGLIGRYAFEVVQKRPQTMFNRVVLICSPNKGSKWDPEVELLTSLQETFLNDKHAVGFPVAGTPAVRELTGSSDVVTALNTHECNSNLGIKYYLFAAEGDLVVSTDSALASGVNMECFTGMSVVRKVLPGGHSTLISDPGAISNMLSYIR